MFQLLASIGAIKLCKVNHMANYHSNLDNKDCQMLKRSIMCDGVLILCNHGNRCLVCWRVNYGNYGNRGRISNMLLYMSGLSYC